MHVGVTAHGQTAVSGMTQSWRSSTTERLEVDKQNRDVCPAHL